MKLDNTPQKAINKLLKWDLPKLINTELWVLLLEKRPYSDCHVNSSNYFCFLWVTFETWATGTFAFSPYCCMSLLGRKKTHHHKANKQKYPQIHTKERNSF